MTKPKKFVFILGLVASSLATSLVLANFLLPYVCKDCQPGFIKQAAELEKFDSRYIYWGDSYCGHDCDSPLQSIATSEPIKIGEQYGNCERILFLGDSFTDSPWNEEDKSYAEYFALNLSKYNQRCYEVVRVATNGSGNDQQYARFVDVVEIVQPKLVVWQFYWNDFYDNVEKPLYESNGADFYRIKPFHNAYFWAGWLYEHIPFIKKTHIGNFLLYFGELKKDLKIDWIAIESNLELLFAYNTKKITFFLNEMKQLEKKYNYQLITTVSPLECEFLYSDNCEQLSNDMQIPFDVNAKVQHQLLRVLQDNSNYISMYESDDYFVEGRVLGAMDFWLEEKEIGARHLGASGQEKVGNMLFLNFIQHAH